ncbi:hypothetical protein [Nonomuraea insulae]|uniref:CU044_5270 family protein n=1 Tax=Nonomuraea insulae TaxID=1616787 RepID=A0ABW1CQE5_9ACTN
MSRFTPTNTPRPLQQLPGRRRQPCAAPRRIEGRHTDVWRKHMKLATARVRLLIVVGAGLAAVGATAVAGLPQAREVRLTAAASAPPEGAYWHTKTLSTSINPRLLGSGANSYQVERRRLSEEWIRPDGTSWFGFREAGAYPKSAADQKAWRRDGSPAKWTRTADGQVVKLSTKPDKGRFGQARGENTFRLGWQKLTYEEVQRLPADPSALKSWLAKAAQVSRIPQNRVDDNVTGTLPELLHSLPAPKEVRAAAYQALLTMPGVHSRGTAKDGVGRTGSAVSIEYPDDVRKDKTYGNRTDLIVDTGTMLLLSTSHTATINGKVFPNKTMTQTLLQAGWTDAAPAVPTLP